MSNFKKRILLVEDDPLIVEIYTTQFKKAGFEIENVVDGESALGILERKQFDLVLLDIVLPKLTGFEILERIKREKGVSGAKIVVLSNLGQKEDVERAKSLGVASYLIKAHYTPSEVVKEVEKILKQ